MVESKLVQIHSRFFACIRANPSYPATCRESATRAAKQPELHARAHQKAKGLNADR
ncbi:MAG TPA: hypothetical protein VHW72_17675 [Candidatus Angelobacter sp.]|jgi:hypothetical protein|nr:hypothetical protein [Candidatus Angelobacter sp.]